MNHDRSHGMGKHMLLMLICCLVPIGLILSVSVVGLSLGPLQPLVPYAIALMCPLMMIVMMRGMIQGDNDDHSHHRVDAPRTRIINAIPETRQGTDKTTAAADQEKCHKDRSSSFHPEEETMNAHTEQASPPIEPTRRGFLKWLLGFSVVGTLTGLLVPIVGYLWPPARKGLGYTGPTMVGALVDFPVGTGKVVPVDNKPVIIVNTAEGGVKAFSAICTHLGCVVDWNKSKNVIQSPCHDGRFNPVTGTVVSGPPPRPLPAYELSVKDGKIYVGKPLGQIYGT